ncbi:MAG: hypothetical protein HDR98_07750 [Bacteroides sp.]|nr:hypothetical protein [Bacteroides sp.]
MIFGSSAVRDSIATNKEHRPIYYDNPDWLLQFPDGKIESYDDGYTDLPKDGWIEYKYLNNRRALTGERCAINKMANSVGVGSWTASLGNMLNDNLDDYCEFNAVASVGVGMDPIVSVRDRSCYYAKGTEAGFCVVAGSGNSVLSLELISFMQIGFYRDGHLIGNVAVKEGQKGSGVQLSVIQIPGTDDACVYFTADAPGVFDEVCLQPGDGLADVNAGQILRVKYAFVGRSNMWTVTSNPDNGVLSSDFGTTTSAYGKNYPEMANVKLKKAQGWNPVLLGLPFPMVSEEIEKLTDADLDNNWISLSPVLAIGYQGGAKFLLTKDYTPAHPELVDDGKEIFKSGTEVGYAYNSGDLLALDAGAWINIRLFDRNNNIVQDETIKAQVLKLGVAQGGMEKTSVISNVPFSGAEIRFLTTLSVKLGAITIHYPFVREAPDVRHHCPITPSNDVTLCPDVTSYWLKSNPEISVTWSVDYVPEGESVSVTTDGHVTNIEGEGPFVFKCTAADGCVDYVTISMQDVTPVTGNEYTCGDVLVNGEGNGTYQVITEEDVKTLTGGLIHANSLTNPENIISGDFDKYAQYIGGLEVLTNYPIIGLKRTDGLIVDATPPGSIAKRVGFLVETNVEGLSLDALQFNQIKCYHNGKEVYGNVIDESNAVDVGLIESKPAQKVRFSISVPTVDKEGKDMQIDQIILWSSGVLALEGSRMNIYYGFVEDDNTPCSDPLGCSVQVLSAKETHTVFDYDLMAGGSGIVVANVVNDLDNIIDDDLDTYCSIANTVSVGNGLPIAIKLGRRVDYRQQIGIVMDAETFLAGVNAGDWMTIETLLNGVKTGDKMTDWKVVDANVIGYGDKRVVFLQPKFECDEILITLGKIIAALETTKFCGIILRGDMDNDGIPDCKDAESCVSGVSEIDIMPVCAGDDVVATLKVAKGVKYDVIFTDPSITNRVDERDDNIEGPEAIITVEYESKQPGQYQVVVYNENGTPVKSAEYTVHPNQTTWRKDATTSDWNKWDNWTNGSPYCCTNVIIPSDARIYPSLKNEIEKGDEYCVAGIHFEPGAEIHNATRLNYDQAWVEMSLKPNRYYLLSSPLSHSFTGDMFVPANMNGVHSGEYFQTLDNTNTPENRFNPSVYQRMWAESVYERAWSNDPAFKLEGTEVIDEFAKTSWSRNFNFLAQPYKIGQGFSLWVDNGTLSENTNFKFRFPKTHKQYYYYSDYDNSRLDVFEDNIERGEGKGRFISEEVMTATAFNRNNYERKIFDFDGDVNFTITSDKESQYLLFGNPFMSSINIHKFLIENSNEVEGVMIYDGNTTHKITYQDGVFAEATDLVSIAPMQAVFIMTPSPVSKVNISLTQDMLNEQAGKDTEVAKSLRLTVHSKSNESSMVMIADDTSSSSEVLIDNEVTPTLAVFAISEGKACDIVAQTKRVPLTIVKDEKESIILDFHAFNGFERDDWQIEDIVAGTIYDLDNPITIEEGVGATAGRYVLVNRANISALESVTEDYADISVEAIDGTLIVRSFGEPLKDVLIYDLNGQCLVNQHYINMMETCVESLKGVVVINATLTNGQHRSFKLILR